MAIVKTLGELTFDRMNDCVKALAKKYLCSVRAIYGSTENGKANHIGSCVLLSHKNTKLLLTAAHVIDNNEITSLYISGEHELVQLIGSCLITSPPNGNRDDDKLDFSILSLTEDVASKIGNVYYIPESEWWLGGLGEKDRCCLALGYPNSKNKKFNPSTKKIKQEPFVYTSTLKKEEELFIKVDGDQNHHYLLDYCEKYSKNETNETVNSVHPKGVSGGGLFLIEGMANPESYRPDLPCSGKLLGILIEFHKECKVLMFTKLSTIAEALTSRSTGTR